MTTQDSTDGDQETRSAAIELLREGEASVSDVAHLAGVDRQLVHYWAKVANIDVNKARTAHLAKKWRGKMGKSAGKSALKLSKTEMRALAADAVEKMNGKRRARRPKA